MAQITLTYECEIGLQDPSAMAVKVAAVDLFSDGTLDLLGMSVNADTTSAAGLLVTREIVLDVLADGEDRFPTDADKIVATRNLFGARLNLEGLVRVTPAEPVVTP